jgi:transcriptional regulator with XRE-family HTH domain
MKLYNHKLTPLAKKWISEYIRLRRKDLGYTQGDLAKMIGCRTATISAIENGGNYTIETFIAILGSLKVHLELSDLPIDHVIGYEKPNEN